MNKYMNLKNQMVVIIEHDETVESPREWDNLGTFYTWEDRYYSPDRNVYNDGLDFLATVLGENVYKIHGKYTNTRDFMDAIIPRMDKKGYIFYQVSKYEHGLVDYSLGCSSGWDSGTVGVIFVKKEKVYHEFNTKNVTSKLREKVTGIFRSELETYTKYVNGEVFGYTVETFDGNHLASCSGFYDYNYDRNSMFEMVNGYYNIGDLGDWVDYDESIIMEWRRNNNDYS